MKLLKAFNLFVLLSVACLDMVAQLRLGQATFSFAAARPLRRTEALATVLSSASYLKSVGGVAFDKVAQPADELDVSDLRIQYNSSAPDGERLSVFINGEEVKTKLYDWELVPIARYAHSDANACFTLFGELNDAERADKLRAEGNRILNYHPDLYNTLLGLRLFQLDILIVEPDLSIHLPKDGNKYVLGTGERAPNVLANRKGMQAFTSKLTASGGNFTSYVICDENQDIRFSVQNNRLMISGQPFYHFWRYDIDDPKVYTTLREKQRSLLASQASAVMQKETTAQAKFNAAERWYLRNIYAAVVDSANVTFEGNGRFLRMVQTYRDLKINYQLSNEKYLNELSYTLAGLKVKRSAKVVYVSNLSRSLSGQPQLFRNINPAVWDAGVKTMRFAAFFRYCKANFPDQWKIFMKHIKTISITPAVETPTVLYPNR